MKRAAAALVLTAALLYTAAAAHAQEVVNYLANNYGAKGDGTTLNTKAIQRAIDEIGSYGWATTLTFKPGVYLTGSLFVKSNVTLIIPKGVTLLGSQNLADYPERPTRVAGIELTWPSALINVYKQTNVTITGEGTIDATAKSSGTATGPAQNRRTQRPPLGLRLRRQAPPPHPDLRLSNIKLGGGLQLRRSGFWTLHICYSHDVAVDGVNIQNNIGGRGPSTDGIDIDSSKSIDIAHADISVNDDALCLKAGRDSDGLRVNRPNRRRQNPRLHRPQRRRRHHLGSETSGGFRNIEAWNITTLGHVSNGILFKSPTPAAASPKTSASTTSPSPTPASSSWSP